MPRKKQVPNLTEMAMQTISKFAEVIAMNLNGMDESVPRPMEQSSSKLRKLCVQSVSQLAIDHLQTRIPHRLHDKLCKEFLNSIDWNRRRYNSTTVMNVLKVFLNHNLKTLQLQDWPYVNFEELFQTLNKLSGLEVINLPIHLYYWNTVYNTWNVSRAEESVLNAIPVMSDLTSFTMTVLCTNEIIRALGQSCQKLETLSADQSQSVTDDCIPYLLECQQLRNITLRDTSVSTSGYAKLLLEPSNLESVCHYHFGQLPSVLEYIEANGSFRQPFNLKSLVLKNYKQKHLELVAKMCPNVTVIELSISSEHIDLDVLSPLRNLTEIALRGLDFHTNRLNVLLESSDSRITELRLANIKNIDLFAISQLCPNLKTFLCSACTFSEPSCDLPTNSVRPFRCLESLQFDSFYQEIPLELLLTFCTDIKVLVLWFYENHRIDIEDIMLDTIFELNPMTQLEVFNILGRTDLSMRTVKKLMRNCPNLKMICNFGEEWDYISSKKLGKFLQKLREKNIELDTTSDLRIQEPL